MKIRTLIICLLVVAFMTTSVSAEICATTGANDNSVGVSGAVSDEEAHIVLLKPGFDVSDAEEAASSADKSQLEKVVEYFGQVSASDKNIEAKIPMRADAEKGKYLLVVNGETAPVYFAPLSERQGTMTSAAKEALTNGSFASFAENDGKYFCNGDMYDKLSNGAKAAGYAADILNKFKNADNTELMPKVTSALNMGIIMEALNENQAVDLTTVKDMSDLSGLKVPAEKIDLIASDKVNNIISDISGKNFASPDAYRQLMAESIFINVINYADNMLNADKKSFFETYAGSLGMELTGYNKLTENKKAEAISKLASENKTTLSALQSALDTICKGSEVTTSNTGGGGGGGGVSGGGSGSGTGMRAFPTTAVSPSDNTGASAGGDKSALSDLSECQWAREAIEYLISVGMISGYNDNTFKPFKNITRAEFVAIIARKYLPEGEYTQSFSDVSPDKWYFGYVESAYNSGIISGVGNNSFAPDANITRQDITVILLRLAEFLEKEISGDAEKFADDESIADYARNAVYSLRGAGIVNGDEKGNFNPTAAATRAQAAQMIYNFVKFLD